jgi:LPS sulfotransferase NodH
MTPEQEAELIEKMAKAISDGDINWRDWVEEARAALRIAKPVIRDEALDDAAKVIRAFGVRDYSADEVAERVLKLKSKGQTPS